MQYAQATIVMVAQCYSFCKVNKKNRKDNMYGVIFFKVLRNKETN